MKYKSIISVKNLSKSYKVYPKYSYRFFQLLIDFIFSLSNKKFNLFNKVNALFNLSFQIKKGEFIGIIGENGSGKSTLLQLINNIISPSNGSINVYGKVSSLIELGSGFDQNLSGYENIIINCAILGLNKHETQQAIPKIIDFADIGSFINNPVRTYSSGMFMRLAFSIVINVEAEIILIDEAFSVGDSAFQFKCINKINELNSEGKTIILVTHDLSILQQNCTRVLYLKKGRLIKFGSVRDVIDKYKMEIIIKNDNSKVSSDFNPNLFDNSTYASNYDINSFYSSYGNFSAQIYDFAIFDKNNKLINQTLFCNEVYKFEMFIKFNKKIDHPIFTVTIRDITGKELCGTNTNIQKINTGKFAIDQKTSVSFIFKMLLANQTYFLTFACSGILNGKLITYHRLYHIIMFKVIGADKVVGFFDINPLIKIKNL